MAYQFLTQEWIDEAKRLQAEAGPPASPPAHTVRMNQIITEVPFGDGEVKAFMDTSSGQVNLDLGELENPDLTVTVDYETAKAIMVDGNPQAGMQAFMEGKVKVQGDLTKLMAAQIAGTGPGAPTLAGALAEITEPAT